MDKFVAEMKKELSYFNAAMKDAASIREANNRRFQTEYAAGENAHLDNTVVQLYQETRNKINIIHGRAVTAVNDWAKLDGAKINADDMALLEGNFPLTAADLRSMLLKHEDNFTMITRIEQYAKEHDLLFALGYVPSPADRLAVYNGYHTSALSLMDSIYHSGGISDSMMQAYGDPDTVTDAKYICVMRGLKALQEPQETVRPTDSNKEFRFPFKPLPGRSKT